MGIQNSGIMRTQETEIAGRKKAVSVDQWRELTDSTDFPMTDSRILVRAYGNMDPIGPETVWATGLHISLRGRNT